MHISSNHCGSYKTIEMPWNENKWLFKAVNFQSKKDLFLDQTYLWFPFCGKKLNYELNWNAVYNFFLSFFGYFVFFFRVWMCECVFGAVQFFSQKKELCERNMFVSTYGAARNVPVLSPVWKMRTNCLIHCPSENCALANHRISIARLQQYNLAIFVFCFFYFKLNLIGSIAETDAILRWEKIIVFGRYCCNACAFLFNSISNYYECAFGIHSSWFLKLITRNA